MNKQKRVRIGCCLTSKPKLGRRSGATEVTPSLCTRRKKRLRITFSTTTYNVYAWMNALRSEEGGKKPALLMSY